MWTMLLILGMFLAPAEAQTPSADFYVAPNGNDAWSGKLASPNRQRTDGPFATVARAQRAVRELRRRGALNRPVVVMIRRGTYYLNEPLVFTPEDSGTAQSPTIYTAYPGEKPVFSGGVALKGWSVTPDGRWQLVISEVANGGWNFIQLWVNGNRRYRPRLPKGGYYTIAEQVPAQPGRGTNAFKFNRGEIRPDWYQLRDVEVMATQIWTMARLRIANVDPQQNIVTFTGHTAHAEYWSLLNKGNRYFVENVREALSERGEWYLDRPRGVLTYLPYPNERVEQSVVIAPRLEQLLVLRGNVEERRWVQHLVFRGITFAHTNWVTPNGGYNFAQAEAVLPAAISAEGARECVFEDCRVMHTGAWAFEFGRGCKRNRVERCELTDLGAGGVKIGEMVIRENEEEVASHQIVRDNLIAHGGRLHPAATGVWIGQSPYNRIEHNEICDFYYTGVSIGWTWGYTTALAHHNVVAYNHIHHLGQGVLSDMGGIYTLGYQEGSVLQYNLIHDVDSLSYGGWGIYFDEGTTRILAENNVVYRTKTGGFHQHYGKENMVRNNIFAFAREGQIQRTRPEEHLSFTFERNIVYWREGPLLHGNWSDNQYRMESNLYWREGGGEIRFAEFTLEQWRAKGQDTQSLIADPLFAAPDKGDFRLRAGSSASQIGFQPFDISKAGRLTNKRKTGTPLAPPAFPLAR